MPVSPAFFRSSVSISIPVVDCLPLQNTLHTSFDMDNDTPTDVPAIKTLRDKEAYLGITHNALPTKEIRDYFRKMVVRMNKKFCHLENEQIMNSQSLLRYVDNFFNTLLLILWDHSDRQIDGR